MIGGLREKRGRLDLALSVDFASMFFRGEDTIKAGSRERGERLDPRQHTA